MKTITLTQGKIALIDDEDFEKISKHKWCVYKRGNTFYAMRSTRLSGGKQKSFRMHRFILGLTDPKIEIDHKDHNGLNNQRDNLRASTHKENSQNSIKTGTPTTSLYKGVSFSKQYDKWTANIKVNEKQIYLGRFALEIEAAHAYDDAALKYFGEFANLNFSFGS